MTREVAINVLKSHYHKNPRTSYSLMVKQATEMAIEALQERKAGKGEIKYSKQGVIFPICSNCDYVATNWVETKYCPNCGAKMEVNG